jgi:hypothetical protein
MSGQKNSIINIAIIAVIVIATLKLVDLHVAFSTFVNMV